MTRAVWVSFVFAGLMLGCARKPNVTISHPLTSGRVDHNVVVQSQKALEDHHGLGKGTLDSWAQLTRLDAEATCFRVMFSSLLQDGVAAPFVVEEWNPVMRAEAQNHADFDLIVSEQKLEQHPGRVQEQIPVGSETVCDYKDQYGSCQRWVTRPTYRSQWKPTSLLVSKVRGELCYPTAGRVAATTEQLALVAELPSKARQQQRAGYFGGARKQQLSFRWGFLVAQR